MENPFEAPQSSVVATPQRAIGAAAVRLEMAKTERAIHRSGSWLVFIGAWLGLIGGIALIDMLKHEPRTPVALPLLLAAAAYITVGMKLLWLRPGFRVPGSLLAIPLIIAFPIGTWLAIRMLVLLLSKDAARVLAPAYQLVLERAPDTAPRSGSPWAALISPIAVIGAIIAISWAMGLR